MSIRWKLLGSAALLVVLMLTVGLLGLRSLGDVERLGHELDVNGAAPLAALGTARAKFNENRALLNNHILEGEVAGKDELEQRIADNAKLIDEQLAAVEPTLETAEAKTFLTDLRGALDAYRGARPPVIELSHAGRADEAYALNREQLVPWTDAVVTAFTALFDSKANLAERKSDEITSTYGSARTLSIALIVIAALLGLAVSFWIARGVTRGVAAIRDAAIRLGDGDLTVEVETRGRDEVAQTARAFATMTARLRETISTVAETASTLAASSQQMATTSEEAGRAVNEIAAAVTNVADGAERQVRMMQETKASTDDTGRAAEETLEIVRGGVETATAASGAMQTHSLCTLEFDSHRPLYDWFLEQLPLPYDQPRQTEFARLELTHTVTSKRKLATLVTERRRRRLGRPTHAHPAGPAPARLPGIGDPRVLQLHRRLAQQQPASDRAARVVRAHRAQPHRPTPDGGAASAAAGDHRLAGRRRRPPGGRALRRRQQPGERGRWHAQGGLQRRAPDRARRLHGASHRRSTSGCHRATRSGCGAPSCDVHRLRHRRRRAASPRSTPRTIPTPVAATRPTDARSDRRCTGCRRLTPYRPRWRCTNDCSAPRFRARRRAIRSTTSTAIRAS